MNPITRQEIFLAAASGEGGELPKPITREEMYLKAIAENGGGGGTGTTNYNALSNKPQINSVELSGNKSLADLGIPTKTSQLTNDDNVVKDASYVHTDNNYDATAKEIVDGVTSALSNKQDTLTFDDAPTENSNNPVKSNGVFTSEQDIYKVMGQMGAKNLLPYPYIHTTRTLNGVTFTDNGDGSITVNTAGAEATTYFTLSYKDYGVYNWTLSGASEKEKKVGNYIISNGLSSFVEGLNIGYNATYTETTISVLKDTVVDNITIYPMVRLASDTDSTYAPYAKTNQELTILVSRIKGMQLPIIDLGTSYTAELKADISSGKFEKAVVGGRLTINGHQYLLAHPDYWLNTGDTQCTTHHMLVVPAGNLVSGKMNSSNDTTGAYIGSGLKSGTNLDETANSALADVAAIIKADFGVANILTHREHFTNAVADGKPSAGAWYNSDIDLMNENMVYGTNIFLPHPDGRTVPNLYTIDKTQIKLFAERPDLITIHAHWWLRDVVSAAHFALVYDNGNAACTGASYSSGVRPAFAIC